MRIVHLHRHGGKVLHIVIAVYVHQTCHYNFECYDVAWLHSTEISNTYAFLLVCRKSSYGIAFQFVKSPTCQHLFFQENQSAFWHSFEQYRIILHFEHRERDLSRL